MATEMLRGPYRLMSDVIGVFVPPGVAGVYVLGTFTPGRLQPADSVGRAERDLAARLIELIGSNSGFMFATAATAAEAYEMECALFHENMLSGRMPHPHPPKDSGLRCPVCGDAG